jgi:hypothetical protein
VITKNKAFVTTSYWGKKEHLEYWVRGRCAGSIPISVTEYYAIRGELRRYGLHYPWGPYAK